MIKIIIGFLGVAFIMFLFSLMVKRSGRNYGRTLEDYLREESNSSFERKKDIPEHMFYIPNIEALNLPEQKVVTQEEASEADFYDDAYNTILYEIPTKERTADKIRKFAKKKMFRMPYPMSNKDIKQEYGYANFDFIVEWEDNFNKYINLLSEYAQELIAENDTLSAEKILLECINAGANISKPYLMLADLYKQADDLEKVRRLNDFVLDLKIDIHVQNKILSYIGRILDVNNDKDSLETERGF
jgi:hypothetical protein